MNIFFNPDENRMRAGWRLGAQFFLMLLIGSGLAFLMSQLFSASGKLVSTLAFATGAVASIYLAARGLDKRPLADYGLHLTKKWLWQVGFGILLAGAVMGLIFLIEYAAGWLTVRGFGWENFNSSYLVSFALYFSFMVVVGFYEELVFRGYQIVNLSEGLNLPGTSRTQAVIFAVSLSSLFFGIAHVFNPNAGWISTLNVALAGAMLAFPFIITGRLSLPVGLHIGWNFFQGGVFGFPVSGVPGRASLLQINQEGPELLTGGGFGPEAGLLGLFGLALIIGGLIGYLKWSGQSLCLNQSMGVYTP